MSDRRLVRYVLRRSRATTSNASRRRWRRHRRNAIERSPSSLGCSHLPSIGRWRDQRTNPVRGVTRAKEQARDRVLEPSELARFKRRTRITRSAASVSSRGDPRCGNDRASNLRVPVVDVGERVIRDGPRDLADDKGGPACGSAGGAGSGYPVGAVPNKRQPLGVRREARCCGDVQDDAARFRGCVRDGRA